jgi:hypothetical protein
MPRGPEKVEGMTKPKRARKRKLETSQGGPEAINLQFSGGQGVHREVESEGHEEKYRAVIKGQPVMNRSAKGGTGRACTMEAKAFSFTHRTKVFADGTVRKSGA